ncbi:MAG: alpha/beta fold hydrolase [Solirubrobacteraceae bacterium]
MTPIVEHTDEIGGIPVFWREAQSERPTSGPVLYVHGVPDSSDLWIPFLERGGGIAVDLPGFGRSGKRADLDYSIAGYDRFLEDFLDHVGVERLRLVVHDWGTAALAFAQRFPARIERLVIANGLPLLPGYRWHRIARLWRSRGVGELFMGAATRWGQRMISREGNAIPGPMPESYLASVWSHFDAGTQRAILRLYRSAPPDALARAGVGLGDVRCPALVLWGAEDPYLPAGFARAYADALGGGAEHEVAESAGHWPWIDRPELVGRIVDFATA